MVERIFERENIDGAMVPRCAGVHAADGEDGLRVGIMPGTYVQGRICMRTGCFLRGESDGGA
jgi:hypothetical protein